MHEHAARRRAQRVGTWVGPVVGLAGLVFVVLKLVGDWPTLQEAIARAHPAALVPAFLAALLGLTFLGLMWRFCLQAVGHRVDSRLALRQYFVGQLGKYVPGGIWPIVGRAELAHRSGASRPTAYWATLLAMSLTYLAAAMLALTAVLSGAAYGDVGSWGRVVVVLPLALLLVHPTILTAVLSRVRRWVKLDLRIQVPSWGTSLGLVAGYIPGWLGVCLATGLVSLALTGQMPQAGNLVFATALAWTAGFLAIPVPGGIGVREAVFTAAFTSAPAGIAAGVAIVARFVFIFADLVGAALSLLLARQWESENLSSDSTPGE